jgi:hypothetical protein
MIGSRQGSVGVLYVACPPDCVISLPVCGALPREGKTVAFASLSLPETQSASGSTAGDAVPDPDCLKTLCFM